MLNIRLGILGLMVCSVIVSYGEEEAGKKYRVSTHGMVVHSDMNPLKLVMYEDDNGEAVHKIEIYRKGDKKPYQIIEGFYSMKFFSSKQRKIYMEDMNFDGYQDFKIIKSWERCGTNCQYNIWLYNPKSGKFNYNEEFSLLTTAVFKSGMVSSFYNLGRSGSIFHRCDFKIVGDKLIMIKSYDQRFDKKLDRYVYTIWKRINGKMVKVEHDVVPWK